MDSEEKKASQALDARQWVDDHGDALYRFAMAHVHNVHAAEDRGEISFLGALELCEQFEGRSHVRTWLIGIIKHKISDHFRRQRKTHLLSEVTPDLEENLFDDRGMWKDPPKNWGVSPSAEVERNEFWDVFRRCLDALPVSLQQVFLLREVDGIESGEICKELEISSTNLWVMLHRARHQLRRCLEVKWFHDKDALP